MHTARIKHLKSMVIAGTLLIAVGFAGGCATRGQEGAAIGGLGGAGLGAIIGHQSGHGWEGAAIGAGAGALGGYIVGNEQDKAEQRRYDRNYDY